MQKLSKRVFSLQFCTSAQATSLTVGDRSLILMVFSRYLEMWTDTELKFNNKSKLPCCSLKWIWNGWKFLNRRSLHAKKQKKHNITVLIIIPFIFNCLCISFNCLNSNLTTNQRFPLPKGYFWTDNLCILKSNNLRGKKNCVLPHIQYIQFYLPMSNFGMSLFYSRFTARKGYLHAVDRPQSLMRPSAIENTEVMSSVIFIPWKISSLSTLERH